MKLNKKLIILVNVLLLVLILSSCDIFKKKDEVKQIDLTKEFIFNNIDKQVETPLPINLVTQNDLGSLEIYSASYDQLGLLIVQDSLDKKGVWSLIENKLIIPLQEGTIININHDSVFTAYIIITYSDGKTAIFDIKGTKVLREASYISAEVVGSKEENYDDEGNFVDYTYYETVTSFTTTDANNGKSPKVEKFKVNIETGQRDLVLSENNYEYGDTYSNSMDNQVDLREIGLEGYYAKIYEGQLFYIYKEENDEFVNSFVLPSNPLNFFA